MMSSPSCWRRFAGLVLATGVCLSAHADDDALAPDAPGADEPTATAPGGVPVPLTSPQFCFFTGRPPADAPYTLLKRVKAGKQTYGKVTDILPRLVAAAEKQGADAIVDYDASQRFGVFPWRLVRPVARGVPIRWQGLPPRDCAGLGGTTLATIIAEDRSPARMRGDEPEVPASAASAP